MGKRAARGNAKEPDSTTADAAAPHAPWLTQLDPADSESGEDSPYDSEAELTGSDAEDSSDEEDHAPLDRRAGSFPDDERNGVSSDDDFDTAVVDVLQHADALVESPQTDAAVGEDGPCAPRCCFSAASHAANAVAWLRSGIQHQTSWAGVCMQG